MHKHMLFNLIYATTTVSEVVESITEGGNGQGTIDRTTSTTRTSKDRENSTPIILFASNIVEIMKLI